MSQRLRRVNEAVREIVAERVGELKDPRIGFVTVTEVRTSPDLRRAEVFYTVLPDDPDSLAATAEGLSSARSMLRRELGSRMRARNVPDLHFTHDPVPEHGRHIEQLLREAKPPTDDRPADHSAADHGDEPARDGPESVRPTSGDEP